MFHADLHVHSRFSRACSKTCDIPGLAWWARRKGLTVLGTGDFTHPGWAEEIRATLVPAEPGLLQLRPDLAERLHRTSAPSCRQPVRFLLSAEISTIYRAGDRTRKVHHLLYAPTLEAAAAISTALAKVGNLGSDGRPILGLDSRHLLDITLNAGPGCYLIPAHIWTPWFAALGSKSGFDAIADCYGDLASHVFAVETGLSSDPAMNWMCSSLDGYQLISNSDAHSPPMLGREATTLDTELDYFAIERALRTGTGLAGTVNFFPEGGRYHLDGHRKCGVRLEPHQSAARGGICPECGRPLTIGVLSRVAELTDRPAGYRPEHAPRSVNLMALPEVVGEILRTGPKSKKVDAEVSRLVAALGPELRILLDIPVAEIGRAGGGLLAEAVTRLRAGRVHKEPGYDGEYGVIRLFGAGELDSSGALFGWPAPVPAPRPPSPAVPPPRGSAANSAPGAAGLTGHRPPGAAGLTEDSAPGAAGLTGHRAAGAAGLTGLTGHRAAGPGEPDAAAVKKNGSRAGRGAGAVLDGLDPEQRAAARAASPLMIIAGPGTGKTRTLTSRIASAVASGEVPAESCLALTFTRRAAEEMRVRLATLLGRRAARLTVTTFHGLGLALLREFHPLAGLPAGFSIADDAAVAQVAGELAGSPRAARALRTGETGRPALRRALAERGLVDFAGLVELAAALLREHPEVAAELRQRWTRLSVDEYQDVDATQYELLRLLAADGRGLTVIGDPDQAIYGFRGADVGFFLRFSADYPAAATETLSTNYRSSPAVVAAAVQAIAPSSLVPGRQLRPAAGGLVPGARNSLGPASGTITFHEAADPAGEAAWIAETIDQLLGGSSFHSLDSGRADGHGTPGIGLADIAVLYRADAQAAALGQGLTRAGLPFAKRTHDLLARRPGVPEIVHELRLRAAAGAAAGAAGPGPGAERSPGPGPGPGAERSPGPGPGQWRGPGPGPGPGGDVAARLRAAVHRLASRAVPGQLTAADLRTAGEVLAPLARRCGDDLDRFCTEIGLGAEVDALDPRADAISLLTLHAAKGLEFEVVFLAGCERGLLPLWLPGAAPGQRPDPDEERRLLFVGITRARRHLLLSCAAERTRPGRSGPAGASPFLAAVDPALLDRSAPPRRRRAANRQLRLL
jgi:DNA helicase-2/ATP-dependent DNA helicase PcrA